jgi:hypothetical protein
MTTPPPNPPDSDPPAPHEHHGVVETLREEIHEVVEHVPQPVRWTVGKLFRVIVLSLLGLVVLLIVSTILYLANRTELVAKELTLVINQALATRSDMVLQIRDIKGNPFAGFRIIEPRVVYRDDQRPLLEAHEMRVGYTFFGLLQRGGPFEIAVDQPVVHLDAGPNGSWRIPKWTNTGKLGKGNQGTLKFGLTLNRAQLLAPTPVGHVSDIDLRLSGSTGAGTRVALERLRWRLGPWHSKLEELTADLESDRDSVRVRIRKLRTADIEMKLSAGWKPEHSEREIHAEITRVRWRWLAEVFVNNEFDVPGQGRLHVDAKGDKVWRGRFDADASWDSLAILGRGLFGWDGRQLQLDSLSGRSLAGNFDGRLNWSKAGWEIGGQAREADPSHWHALRLDGWPAGKLNGAFKYALDSRAKVNHSALDARLIPSEWAGWNVDSSTVRINFPGYGPDSFTVAGWRRGGRFTLKAGVTKGGWSGDYAIDAFPLEEWPDGRASGLRGTLAHGAGHVENHAGELHVTGDLAGGVTDWSAAHFSRWTLTGIDGRLLPTPDLTAGLRLRDGFFIGLHVDSADAGIHLGDGDLTYTPAHAYAGDTLFTARGGASWSADHWRVLMTYASLASAQFAWVAEPPLEFSGDPQGTVFDRVVADDGPAHLEAKGRWAAPGGFYDFGLDAHGLSLNRLGMPLDWRLDGRGDARLAVSGRSGDPSWTFEGRSSRPGFAGHRCDTLSLSLAGRMNELRVHDLLYGLDGGIARVALQVTRTAQPWPDSLTGTAVLRWLQDAGAWNGVVTASRLPVDHLGAVAAQGDGWGGVVDGRLALGGSPPRPEFDLQASADDLGYRDYRAQHVEARATYHEGALEVPSMKVTMQDVVSTLRGGMAVQLALGHPPEVPDRPMSWTIEVPRGDLKLLPALVPLIQSARGQFDLDAALSGTARHPKLSGRGHIRSGTVRPAGREEILENVYADLHFDESHIVLDTLSAKQGRTGRVWARGTVDMNGFELKNYRFALTMREFAATQTGLYAMLFDGDFAVTDGPRVLGERLPQVTGDVRLKRGVVEFDFANQSEVQKRAATTEPLYWTYRIRLDASNNLRWRPPDGDIEFNAALELEQTPDSLLIYGDMHLIKGHYFFLSNRFDLSQADLNFDNQKGVDPVLDILAQTKLRPSRGDLAQGGTLGKAQIENIDVHLTGRSSQPIIELTSSSGWDQREILGELTYGRFQGEGVSQTDFAGNYLTRQLSNQLSRELSTFFNDAINQWEVQRDQGEIFGGQGRYLLSVGGALTPRTSWIVRQRLPGLGADTAVQTAATSGTTLIDRDVEVEYRINRFIYATTELTQRRVGLLQSGQTGTDFNVNLKARWEY